MVVDNKLCRVLRCVEQGVVGGAEVHLAVLHVAAPRKIRPVLVGDHQASLVFSFSAFSPPPSFPLALNISKISKIEWLFGFQIIGLHLS